MGRLLPFRRPDDDASPAVVVQDVPKALPRHRPILPAWVLDPKERRDTVSRAARHTAHRSAFHVVRAPKYGARLVV